MRQPVRLGLDQFDIVWSDLKLGEHPYPLDVPAHGKTVAERAAIRRRVYAELTAWRLANESRLDAEVVNALHLLARPPLSIDMTWLAEPDATEIRVVRQLFARARLRCGQITVSWRDRQGKRTTLSPLDWFDTDSGRCISHTTTGHDGRRWITFAGADNQRIAARLAELLTGSSA